MTNAVANKVLSGSLLILKLAICPFYAVSFMFMWMLKRLAGYYGDIIYMLEDKSNQPKTISEAMQRRMRDCPDDPIHQQYEAENELKNRAFLGRRKHDA